MEVSPILFTHSFLEFFADNKLIKIEEIKSPSRTFVKYIWGNVPTYDLLLPLHRNSYKNVSAKQLVSILLKLDQIYPYYQAVGFHMQRVGYEDSALKVIRESNPIEYDFYLANEMKEKDYSKEWRLYFPTRL